MARRCWLNFGGMIVVSAMCAAGAGAQSSAPQARSTQPGAVKPFVAAEVVADVRKLMSER